MTEPDHDRLLARVRADVDAGRAWRARERLRAYVAQFDHDPRFVDLLGRLELEAGELPEAGRWLWLAGSDDPGHREAIALFLDRHDGAALWRALPKPVRRDLPAHVRTELEQRKFHVDRARRRAERHGAERSSTWSTILGVAVLLVVFVALGLGLVELWRMVAGWLGVG